MTVEAPVNGHFSGPGADVPLRKVSAYGAFKRWLKKRGPRGAGVPLREVSVSGGSTVILKSCSIWQF